MEESRLVAIGLPVYNGEKYVEQAIISVLRQTWEDFELIIADNASTDGTAEICKRYAAQDRRIRYYRNARNLGAAPNYNRVFELSNSKYFKWADYDDLLSPDFLARCLAGLEENPDAVLCYPRARLIDEQQAVLCEYDPLPDTSSLKPQIRFRNLILAPHLAVQSMGLMRSAAIRRTMLHGSFPSSDEIFLAEMALQGRFVELPERLLSVRIHPEQSTRGPRAWQRDRVTFFDTSLAGQIVLVKWLYCRACFQAAYRAPIGGLARASCYLHIVRWSLRYRTLRALCKDAVLGTARTWGAWRQRTRRVWDNSARVSGGR
jgi:glycosyltransferase involved in cell wall biosynthesis